MPADSTDGIAHSQVQVCRHLIYNNDHADEQQKLYDSASEHMKLLSRDNWLAVRDFGAFERSGVSLITHGGSSFTEVVVPFIQL